MPERGIADVVGEAGGLYDFSDIFRADGFRQFATLFQKEADHDAERAACAGDFERVHLPVMDVVVGREGVYLRFARECPEGIGKEDTVVVLKKWASGAVEMDFRGVGHAVADGGEQFCPLFFFCPGHVFAHVFVFLDGIRFRKGQFLHRK